MERENEYLDMDVLNKKISMEKEKKEKKGYFYSGLVMGLASALLIVSLVYLGTRIQAYMDVQQQTQAEIQEDETQTEETSVVDDNMVAKLQTIEQIVDYYYYKEDFEKDSLKEGAYAGMMEALGDPYSVYYTEEELNELMDQTQGIYYGIGAGVIQDTETLLTRISKVYPNTPAKEAGLREDDLIYEVGGQSTYDVPTSEVVTWIKGEEGTKVTLTIIRDGEADFLEIEVERRKVEFPTVSFEMKDDDIAYIAIEEFDEVTTEQFADALATAKGSGMKGLVLDLRSNPGGNLDTVVNIARMMLPEGMIVYTEDKYGKRTEYKGDGSRQLEVPLVVLINGNSASASEILAGAVKDYGVGTLVGTTTFGKGIVQQVIPLQDGSAVKVTVSSYFTPKGNNIHGIGIEPDVECVFDGEAYYGNPDHPDNQLEKALEVVKEKIAEKGNR